MRFGVNLLGAVSLGVRGGGGLRADFSGKHFLSRVSLYLIVPCHQRRSCHYHEHLPSVNLQNSSLDADPESSPGGIVFYQIYCRGLLAEGRITDWNLVQAGHFRSYFSGVPSPDINPFLGGDSWVIKNINRQLLHREDKIGTVAIKISYRLD